MKLTVSKTAAKGEATRGAKSLIKLEDFELNVWRNDNNQIKKFELRIGKVTKVFDDNDLFINWGGVMNWTDIYLSDLSNAAAQLAAEPTLTKSQQYKLKKGNKGKL
jgi:hypothetical protein